LSSVIAALVNKVTDCDVFSGKRISFEVIARKLVLGCDAKIAHRHIERDYYFGYIGIGDTIGCRHSEG